MATAIGNGTSRAAGPEKHSGIEVREECLERPPVRECDVADVEGCLVTQDDRTVGSWDSHGCGTPSLDVQMATSRPREIRRRPEDTVRRYCTDVGPRCQMVEKFPGAEQVIEIHLPDVPQPIGQMQFLWPEDDLAPRMCLQEWAQGSVILLT